jgi:hypothetical protein
MRRLSRRQVAQNVVAHARASRRNALRDIVERYEWMDPLFAIQRNDPERYRRILERAQEATWVTGHEAMFWGPPIHNSGARARFPDMPWQGYA